MPAATGCCCCNLGAYVPRFKNVSHVRKTFRFGSLTVGETYTIGFVSGADWTTVGAASNAVGVTFVATAAGSPASDGWAVSASPYPPFERVDTTYDGGSTGSGICYDPVSHWHAPPGTCGIWLKGGSQGDYNGLSTQDITDMVDDILAGAAGDATHYSIDHDSYQSYPSAPASFFQVGDIAQIVSLGSTDWHAMGASVTPKVNDIFTVTMTGSGSGTAQLMTDMLMARRRGGQWIFAQKYWHGRFGFLDNENGTLDPTKSPATSKWRTITTVISTELVNTDTATPPNITGSIKIEATYVSTVDKRTGVEVRSVASFALTQDKDYVAWDERFQLRDLSLDTDLSCIYGNGAIYQMLNIVKMAANIPGTSDVAATNMVDRVQSNGYTTNGLLLTYGSAPYVNAGDTFTFTSMDTGGTGSMSVTGDAAFASSSSNWTADDGSTIATATATASITNTVLSFGFTANQSQPSAGKTSATTCSMTITLSDEYTDVECANDFAAALADWDMSDFKQLNSLRTDENLAHSALCIYDELPGANAPSLPVFSYYNIADGGYIMNDKNRFINDTVGRLPWTYDPLGYAPNTGTPPPTNWTAGTPGKGDWNERFGAMDWRTGNDYIWKFPATASRTSGTFIEPTHDDTWAGAVCVKGLYSGEIISRTRPHPPYDPYITLGITDRHFWFNAVNYRREEIIDETGPTGRYQWNAYSHGAYSDSQLPTPTMRWMPPQYEQYDGAAAGTPPIGNFPQQFTDFSNGCLKGGKYCQAVQKWNAVDFLQPSGKRKFDVDQTTVCGVVSGSAPNFVVCQTGFYDTAGHIAKAPLATGGLAVNDYIIVEGDGIYKISAIAATSDDAFGRHNWTVTVGAQLDTLPTGYAFSDPDQRSDGYTHLGRIRWLGYTQYAQSFASAPGITGRVAITTSYAAGVLTVNTTAAQPYFRKGVDAALRAVNLYDAGGTMLNGSPLVLARTDDSHFTATTANYPTAVWMADAALTWAQAQFTNANQNTGVHIKWGFDKRKAAAANEVVVAIAAHDAAVIALAADPTNPTLIAAEASTSATVTAKQSAYTSTYGAYPPTWLNGVTGCNDADYFIEQFNYLNGSCPAIVGIVPFTPDDGTPPTFAPVEGFTPQVLFDFPTVPVDASYGAHSQSMIGLTMIDPFDQVPFKPDCDYDPTSVPDCYWSWKEDDGSGLADVNEGNILSPCYGELRIAYYAHRPIVEATKEVPAGKSLPTGLSLFYDPANKFPPPNYPNGIPYGASVTSDWGTTERMCAAARFTSSYTQFDYCP